MTILESTLTNAFLIVWLCCSTDTSYAAIDMQLEKSPNLHDWGMDSTLESFELDELDGLSHDTHDDYNYGLGHTTMAECQPLSSLPTDPMQFK